MRLWTILRAHPAAAHMLACVIAVYGALLRLDAFTGKYGPLDRPAWARVVTEEVAPMVPSIRPAGIVWGRVAHPYAGGDPINYPAYAREMTSFYQPRRSAVRLAGLEPAGGRAPVVRARAAGAVTW